jgi:hypothetical protein
VTQPSYGKADKVIVYRCGAGQPRSGETRSKPAQSVFEASYDRFFYKDTSELAKLANRTIKRQIKIQDGDVMVSAGDRIVSDCRQSERLLHDSTATPAKPVLTLSLLRRQSPRLHQCPHLGSCPLAPTAIRMAALGRGCVETL